jgi:hypothetical protein
MSGFNVVLPDGRKFGPASMEVLEQWAREGRVPRNAMIEPADGSGPARPVMGEARLAVVVGAPPTAAGEMAMPADGGVSTLIPYKNGMALAAYYVSVASLIPGLGILTGPVAIGLGVAGVRAYRRNPAIKGVVHAWVGIVLGLICFLLWGGLVVAGIVAAMMQP